MVVVVAVVPLVHLDMRINQKAKSHHRGRKKQKKKEKKKDHHHHLRHLVVEIGTVMIEATNEEEMIETMNVVVMIEGMNVVEKIVVTEE